MLAHRAIWNRPDREAKLPLGPQLLEGGHEKLLLPAQGGAVEKLRDLPTAPLLREETTELGTSGEVPVQPSCQFPVFSFRASRA